VHGRDSATEVFLAHTGAIQIRLLLLLLFYFIYIIIIIIIDWSTQLGCK